MAGNRLARAVTAPSDDPAYEADELLRQLGISLGHDDVTISFVGAVYVYEGHWTQISHKNEIGYGDTLVEALQDALARGGAR